MEISPVDADLPADRIVTVALAATMEETATMDLAADVTKRNRPVAADRKMDADVLPQNRPVRPRLRQDRRDRLMKTADGNDLSDKKDQSVMPWSSFSLTSYK